MKKAFYYPPASRIGYENPYSINFKKNLENHFELLDSKNEAAKMQVLPLLKYSFIADVFIINWLESISFNKFGFIQFILAIASLHVIRFRKKRLIWMFHNIRPHQGENFYSKTIQNFLFANADKIISHSVDAYHFAKNRAAGMVEFVCHPVEPISFIPMEIEENIDVLIWGNIFPYKGVVEFLESLKKDSLKISVCILGLCKDLELSSKINKLCDKSIRFYNRKANFDEIASYIRKSKYVLFPYIGECVSSSGALIDTIVMGGTPVGPKVGAFKDLAQEHMCLAYNSYAELFDILKSNNIQIKDENRKNFIKQNSWDNFIKRYISK